MAVRPGEIRRERRPAMWPWLLMPLVVLLVFYALLRVHRSAPRPINPSPDTSATDTLGR